MINRASTYNFGSVIAVRVVPALLYIYSIPHFISAHGSTSYAKIILITTVVSLSIILESATNYFFFNRFSRLTHDKLNIRMRIYWPNIFIIFIMMLSLSAIAFLIYRFSGFELALSAAILFMIMPTTFGSSLIYSYWQADNKGYIGNVTRSLTDILRASGLLIGAIVNDGFAIAISIYVVGFYLRFLTDLFLIKKRLKNSWKLQINFKNFIVFIKAFYTKTFPVLITSAVSTVLQFLDKPISSLLFGERQMVSLSFAAEISSKIVILQYAIGFVFTYYFGKAYRDRDEKARLTRAFLIAVVSLLIIFVLPLYIYAEAVLTAWLGSTIARDSYEILRLLLVAQAIYMIGNVFEIRNTFTGTARKNISPYIIMLLTYFCSLALFSGFGVIAIAYSLILSQFVALVYFVRSAFI